MRATKLRATFVSIIVFLSASATEADNWQPHRVAVIDTGLDIKSNYYKSFLCKNGHKDFTGAGLQDDDGHGTEVVDLIIRNAGNSNFCLVVYKFFTKKVKGNWDKVLLKALKEVSKQKFELVNLSLSGPGYSKEEDVFFSKNRNITFVAAAGNDGLNLDTNPRYPASYDYPNILVVGAINKYTKSREQISNYGYRVKFWEIANATSYAAAIKTGKIIKEKFGNADGIH